MDDNPYDFETQQATLAQQKLVADRLRKTADASTAGMPQGQMVSGRYVGINPLQAILPMVQNYQAGAAEGDLAKGQQQYTQGLEKAKNAWMADLDQATTEEQVLKKAVEASRIPGLEKAGEAYATGARAKFAREDTQTENWNKMIETNRVRADEKANQLGLEYTRLAQLAVFQQGQLANTAAGTAQRAEAARQHEETQIKLKGMEAAINEAKNAAKPLDATARKDLKKTQELLDTNVRLRDEFKKEFAGAEGIYSGVKAKFIPAYSDPSSTFWKNYKSESENVRRHDYFGSALTPQEQQEWKDSDVSFINDPKQVEEILERRAFLSKKLMDYTVGLHKAEAHMKTLGWTPGDLAPKAKPGAVAPAAPAAPAGVAPAPAAPQATPPATTTSGVPAAPPLPPPGPLNQATGRQSATPVANIPVTKGQPTPKGAPRAFNPATDATNKVDGAHYVRIDGTWYPL